MATTPGGHEYSSGLAMKIEAHWRKYRPRMVRDLEKQGFLHESVETAARLTSDAMYELEVEKKLPRDQAWELVREEWAFLPSEEDQPNLGFDPVILRELAQPPEDGDG